MPTPAFARGRLFAGMTRWAAFVRQSLGRLALYQSAKLLTYGQRGTHLLCHGRQRPATHDFPLLYAAKSWMAGLRRP